MKPAVTARLAGESAGTVAVRHRADRGRDRADGREVAYHDPDMPAIYLSPNQQPEAHGDN
jgi:hypothetical protein